MAGFSFSHLVTDLEAIANLTSVRAMVKRLIIEAIGVIAGEHEWQELWDDHFFTTVAVYETGTVTVTNNSTTVTGSGTTFTSAMVGRKIRVGTEAAYYVIAAFVSATELTLEAPYQGDTASGASYTIYQDEYRLRGDVDQAKLMRQMENGSVLISKHVSDLDVAVPAPQEEGSADFEVQIGTRQDTYNTGTVSMSSGSRTLTGTSTAWTSVPGLSRGNKIQIGSLLFTIRSVDSATQITVYEAATSAITAGTSYTILLTNPVVQLYTIPNAVENYYYRYQRIPAIPDADADLPDLPHYLHALIKPYALQFLWEHKGFLDRVASAQKTYDRLLTGALRRHGMANPDRVYRRQSADRLRRVWPRYGLLLK